MDSEFSSEVLKYMSPIYIRNHNKSELPAEPMIYMIALWEEGVLDLGGMCVC